MPVIALTFYCICSFLFSVAAFYICRVYTLGHHSKFELAYGTQSEINFRLYTSKPINAIRFEITPFLCGAFILSSISALTMVELPNISWSILLFISLIQFSIVLLFRELEISSSPIFYSGIITLFSIVMTAGLTAFNAFSILYTVELTGIVANLYSPSVALVSISLIATSYLISEFFALFYFRLTRHQVMLLLFQKLPFRLERRILTWYLSKRTISENDLLGILTFLYQDDISSNRKLLIIESLSQSLSYNVASKCILEVYFTTEGSKSPLEMMNITGEKARPLILPWV